MEELLKEYEGLIPANLLKRLQEELPEKTKKSEVKKFLDRLRLEYENALKSQERVLACLQQNLWVSKVRR